MTDFAETNIENIPAKIEKLRSTFKSGKTKPLYWREGQLRSLLKLLTENETSILDALRLDMSKPEFEAWPSEVGLLISEIKHTLKYLEDWSRDERVSTNIVNLPAKSFIKKDPLGVVLIIAPWNYPLQLLLGPLIPALAAGNCVVLKPSEISENTAKLVTELIPKYLDEDAIQVVEGAVEETQALLAEKFDHIFYTGNGTVGRIVMKAAAEHLTPVTLELGGKSPCIVDHDASIAVSAKRIIWGKFYNAGQTCISPDYVLVHHSIEQQLLEHMKKYVEDFYGRDAKNSPDLSRIINDRHFRRLTSLLEDGETVTGGQTDPNERYIAPTILRNVDPNSAIMQDEIFGPILPVIAVNDLQSAIDFVNNRPNPLALYVFSKNKDTQNKVLRDTSSGGACINDCVAHMTVPDLPFGGVGASGMGNYHGKSGFDTFTHHKSVLDKALFIDPPIRYAPYSDTKLHWVKKLF